MPLVGKYARVRFFYCNIKKYWPAWQACYNTHGQPCCDSWQSDGPSVQGDSMTVWSNSVRPDCYRSAPAVNTPDTEELLAAVCLDVGNKVWRLAQTSSSAMQPMIYLDFFLCAFPPLVYDYLFLEVYIKRPNLLPLLLGFHIPRCPIQHIISCT